MPPLTVIALRIAVAGLQIGLVGTLEVMLTAAVSVLDTENLRKFEVTTVGEEQGACTHSVQVIVSPVLSVFSE